MLYDMEHADYVRAVRQQGQKGVGSSHLADYMERVHRRVVHELVAKLGKTFSSQELTVMLFVADRTLFYSSLSTLIYRDQFFNGMVDENSQELVFSGINISEMTLRKVLNSLTENNFLHVGICKNASNGIETTGRLYAINCKKVADIDIMDEAKPMILRIPKRLKNDQTPPLNLAPLYTHNRITKVIHTAASAAGSVAGISRRNTAVQSIAKNDQMSAKDKVTALQINNAQRRAVLQQKPKTVTTTGQFTKASVQKTINENMAAYFPDLPTMRVTDKPFGKMRKDLLLQPVKDIADFFQFVISSWEQIVSDHGRARQRQMRDGLKQSYAPLPAAPDFATIAYRFPYFIKCYNSYLVQGSTARQQKDDQKDAEIARLRRYTAQLQGEAQAARQSQRRARQNLAEEQETDSTTPARVRRTPQRRVVSDQDDYIPSWEEHNAREANRR